MEKYMYTIGYEGSALEDFWATLVRVGVRNLLDVRDIPFSRKAGFSKKTLSFRAEKEGISYYHLSGLGDPKEGREAAKAGDYTQFNRIFQIHMMTPAAQSDLAIAARLVQGGTSCLLCYERKPEFCHRSIVADHLKSLGDIQVHHLGVQKNQPHKAMRKSDGKQSIMEGYQLSFG